MATKPVINYSVVRQYDEETGVTTYHPQIVERAQTLDIETVAKMAYQNGLTRLRGTDPAPHAAFSASRQPCEE